jgi:hypothetical protein
MRNALRALFVSVVFAGTVMTVHAGELPAVSGPNGKVSVEGGSFDDESAGIALGSFAMPLGNSFGLQADGALGSIDDEILGGGGLHLFTRDPSNYLLGVYGSYHTWDSIDIWRLAGEAELYLGRFTLASLAGYESVEVPSTLGELLVLTPDDKHFFGQFDASYYITDDFKVSAGYHYLNETSLGSAGAEYLIRGHEVPMSLFARGNFGDDQYTSVTGGLKIYLSADPDKSLIDRNRRDDPESYLPVFPKLVAGSNKCTVGPSPQYKVTSKTDCSCPAGTPRSGNAPRFISALGGFYTCGNSA